MIDKSSLRKQFIELLNRQGSREREEKSRFIADQLYALPVFQQAKTVLFYASMPGEVDTFVMMTQAMKLRKRIALPIISRDQRKMIPTLTHSLEDLSCGPYNIRQPHADPAQEVDLSAIDAVIVPGLAFDKAKNRLGRGAGYYDRFLASLPEKTSTVGLAFDFQVIDSLPVEEHDVPCTHLIIA